MITKEQRNKEKLLRYKDAVSDLIEGLETGEVTAEDSTHTQLTPQKKEFIKNMLLKKSEGITKSLESMDSIDSCGYSPISDSSSAAHHFDNIDENQDEALSLQEPNKYSPRPR